MLGALIHDTGKLRLKLALCQRLTLELLCVKQGYYDIDIYYFMRTLYYMWSLDYNRCVLLWVPSVKSEFF